MSARFVLDTSCIIALLCTWHPHHRAVIREVGRRLDEGESMIVSAHAVTETYSVLTRLPAPHRLSPSVSFRLLDENLRKCHAFSLDPPRLWELLERLSSEGVAGGRTYDGIIAATAVLGGASSLLTLNERDFVRIVSGELEIVRPADP